jgi:hypothetical protein
MRPVGTVLTPRKVVSAFYRQNRGVPSGRCGPWCIYVSAGRAGAAVPWPGVGLFTLVRQESVRGIKRPWPRRSRPC